MSARANKPSPALTAAEVCDISPERAEALAQILRAVAHPLRLRIIAVLCQEDLHVSALAERLGAKQAVVSQQLKVLRLHQLIDASREGGLMRYRLVEPRLRELVRCISSCTVRHP